MENEHAYYLKIQHFRTSKLFAYLFKTQLSSIWPLWKETRRLEVAIFEEPHCLIDFPTHKMKTFEWKRAISQWRGVLLRHNFPFYIFCLVGLVKHVERFSSPPKNAKIMWLTAKLHNITFVSVTWGFIHYTSLFASGS